MCSFSGGPCGKIDSMLGKLVDGFVVLIGGLVADRCRCFAASSSGEGASLNGLASVIGVACCCSPRTSLRSSSNCECSFLVCLDFTGEFLAVLAGDGSAVV